MRRRIRHRHPLHAAIDTPVVAARSFQALLEAQVHRPLPTADATSEEMERTTGTLSRHRGIH